MSRHAGVKTVWLTSKERFRRHGLKSFSYRYEVTAASGPQGEPILESGTAIIETRYRGRSATWSIARSMMDTEHYNVDGTFLEPSADNPFTYPPKTAAAAAPPPAPSAPVAAPASQAPAPPAAALRQFGRDLVDRAFGPISAAKA